MCITHSCCAHHTLSNFAMLWNQLLTVLAWLWFYCWMHFNCIYRPEVLQLIYIRFNVMMPLSNPTMNIVCNIPLVFICVHNNILCFLSYHVPMFSLLMYFVRNDKNKDDQSINQSIIIQSVWISEIWYKWKMILEKMFGFRFYFSLTRSIYNRSL